MNDETDRLFGFVLRRFGIPRTTSELAMTVTSYTKYASKLMRKILPQSYPLPLDLRFIILAMGTALEIQMAKDPKIEGKRMGVCKVMRLIGIKKEHIDRYESLHCYYDATKHWDKAEHATRKSMIAGKRGKEIAAMFYESVRKILVDYYPNLRPIDFLTEGIRLDWEDKSLACP
jgi:hypothetical protein